MSGDLVEDSEYPGTENTDTEKMDTENPDIDIENTDSEDMDSEEMTDMKDFTMFFTGDVMLQYCIGIYAQKGINGLITSYIQQEMVNADMTMINHEFPFSTRGERHRINSTPSV
jgi:hypothetical protein